MSTHTINNANIVTFIVTDPLAVGFLAIRTASPGVDAPLLAACNSNTGLGAGTKAGSPITAAALLDLISASEFSAMTTAELTQLQTILATQTVNVGNAPSQAKLNSLFANYLVSLDAIQATYSQPASPWEVYFGAGQVATTALLDAARNSGSGGNF
jgi:hypothetical protein